MYDTLLVPIDETAETTRLLERAIDVAEAGETTIHVLAMVDGPRALNAEGTGEEDRVAGARERATRAAMRAVERAQRSGVDAQQSVRRGIPHTELVDEAARVDADVILLGPSGRETTDGPVCSGAVTTAVVERATRAVLVVPVDGPEAVESSRGETEREAETDTSAGDERTSVAPDA